MTREGAIHQEREDAVRHQGREPFFKFINKGGRMPFVERGRTPFIMREGGIRGSPSSTRDGVCHSSSEGGHCSSMRDGGPFFKRVDDVHHQGREAFFKRGREPFIDKGWRTPFFKRGREPFIDEGRGTPFFTGGRMPFINGGWGMPFINGGWGMPFSILGCQGREDKLDKVVGRKNNEFPNVEIHCST